MKISLQYSVKNKPPTLLKQLRFAILSKLNFKNSKNYYTQSSLFLKLSVFTFILLIFTEGVQAQQEGQQTLFMFNTVAINPAVAGSRDIPTMTLTTRNQWVGFKGAPIQQNMSFHTPFLSKRLGMSMTLGNRSIGIFRSQTTSLALSYSPVKTENFHTRLRVRVICWLETQLLDACTYYARRNKLSVLNQYIMIMNRDFQRQCEYS